jgi:NAD(P)-dependent dehydrogenase (short-subunit alcohol dehydrogenase family)
VAIAGAAGGIGADTAIRIAEEGARVVIGDLNADGAESTAMEIRECGGEAVAIALDIAEEDQVERFIAFAVETYGGLDGLFNNAADISAANLGADTDAVTIPNEVWQHTLNVNLTGYLFGVRYAVPELIKRGGGSILNTVSDSVYLGEPVRLAYAVSKTAITALSRHTASRWGPDGIRSNCLAPGPVLTEGLKAATTDEDRRVMMARIRYPRLGEADDLGAAAAFLLSDDAEFISGQTIRVNGGQTFS